MLEPSGEANVYMGCKVDKDVPAQTRRSRELLFSSFQPRLNVLPGCTPLDQCQPPSRSHSRQPPQAYIRGANVHITRLRDRSVLGRGD